MKASDCSFDQMRRIACSIPELGYMLSFYQVEYGLKHIKNLWDIFTEILDHDEEIFQSAEEICKRFSLDLSEFNSIESSESIPN